MIYSIFDAGNMPIDRKSGKESRKLSFLLYQSLYGPVVLIKAIYRQVIILLLMFLWGAGTFAYFEYLPPLAAFLASISTITTIGLYVPNGGNFTSMNPIESLLLIGMIITSVGAGASILQSSVSTIAKGNIGKSQAQMELIKKLKRHVIVYGYEHVGKYVTEKLNDLGFDYVVVTKNQSTYDDLVNEDIFVVLEHEIEPIATLKAAGIDQAAIVITSYEKDADNMLIILSARKVRPDIRIISLAHDQSLTETAKNAGANVVIPESATLGHLLALSAVVKNLIGVVFSEKVGTKEIAEFTVSRSSPLVGKGLPEISKLVAIVGVVRGNQVLTNIFEPNFKLEENDTIIGLGNTDKVQGAEQQAKAV